MPDDYLKNLPGSQDAPELARSLTFNVYARDVRHYKKRNLQQAAQLIVAFMRAHPELFVGVTLDPDTYINPFFDEKQWYDYNPGTLRQFRAVARRHRTVRRQDRAGRARSVGVSPRASRCRSPT